MQILTHGDTVGGAEPAFSQLSSAIEVGQTLDVDLVSGASYSSQGMLDAIINAIKAGPSSGTGQ